MIRQSVLTMLVFSLAACGGGAASTGTSLDAPPATQANGTITGDPENPTASYDNTGPTNPGTNIRSFAWNVLGQMCFKLQACFPNVDVRGTCFIQGPDATGFAEAFGLDPVVYPTLASISDAESSASLSARGDMMTRCLAKINHLNCDAPAVAGYFSASPSDRPYVNLASLIPDDWDDCNTVFNHSREPCGEAACSSSSNAGVESESIDDPLNPGSIF